MDAPKHIFFDMDGTLTHSRCNIGLEMRLALATTCDFNDVVIVSGASMKQMEKQLAGFRGRSTFMAQNGNHVMKKLEEVFWRNELNWLEKHDILWWIWEACQFLGYTKEQMNLLDLVEDRGCQISFSLLGHHADTEEKEAFDPKQKKRRELLEKFPFHAISGTDIEVAIGGTTCLDFFQKGKNKGANIGRFIKEMNWNPEECLYIGDALFNGGNDASVVGVVPVQPTYSPEDTIDIIRKMI